MYHTKEITSDLWEVTGESGFSKLSLNLLRLFTLLFIISVLGVMLVIFGVMVFEEISINSQARLVVFGVISGILTFALGFSIALHPEAYLPLKILYISYGVGLLGFKLFIFRDFVLTQIFLSWGISPLVFLPGLPMIVALICFIPITYYAWVGSMRETED